MLVVTSFVRSFTSLLFTRSGGKSVKIQGAEKIGFMVKKILLAEDDPDIRLILNMILNDAGYEVETLHTGTSIVEGRVDWPDLFILDKALPTIDGLALCKFLKVKKETRHIPIIMISSYHKLKRRASEVGADDFLEKPFDVKVLLQQVEKHMQSKAQV